MEFVPHVDGIVVLYLLFPLDISFFGEFFITLLYVGTFSSHETAVGCIVLQLKLL